MSYNIIKSIDSIDFMPFAERNYAPTRTFVTKWDIEIKNNRAKKINRNRDRDAKYFDYYDSESEFVYEYFDDEYDYERNNKSINMNDGDGEETREKWLQSIRAENEYFEKYEKYEKYFNI
jgi:hypothetical protein